MDLNPKKLTKAEVYRLMTSLIVPRPISWVGTLSPEGKPNLAPFSFFMGMGSNPPALAFSVAYRRDGSRKDTARNIHTTGEFVVSIVPHRMGGDLYSRTTDRFSMPRSPAPA